MKSLAEYKSLLAKLFHKYKYIILVAAAGLALIFWPSGGAAAAARTPAVSEEAYDVHGMERKLESLLSKAKGVGRVEVILSLKSGMSYEYAGDGSRASEKTYADGFMIGSQEEEDRETVILRDAGGSESPLVVRQSYPEYLGALVVCEGAENASVRLRVAQAIFSLTGIPFDHIVVIPMED